VTAQESVTLPVKPPLGVTVMVEVPLAPADAMFVGVPLSEKAGVTGALGTVIAMVVVAVRLPEVPVTVIV
jgi:hypothetical protein